ncbi:hypothetical protein FKM82_019601, partial [Ascaphus truei]
RDRNGRTGSSSLPEVRQVLLTSILTLFAPRGAHYRRRALERARAEVGILSTCRLSLGVTVPTSCMDFMHYWHTYSLLTNQGNLLCLVRCDEESEDEDNELVMTSLCHQSSLILRAEGLATGFCKDVHGQLKITWRAPSRGKGERDRSEIYQYKI